MRNEWRRSPPCLTSTSGEVESFVCDVCARQKVREKERETGCGERGREISNKEMK